MRFFVIPLLVFLCTEIWSQEPRLVLPIGHTGEINCVQYSSNGRCVVTGSNDNTVKVWDANTGLLLLNLIGHKDLILDARFSPDDKKILTTSCDSTVKIWDIYSGSVLFELKVAIECIYSARFSPDGQKITATSGDSTASIWNGNTGQLIALLKGHKGSINEVNFSPDGKKVITASSDSTSKIWDAVSGKLLGTLKGHTKSVTKSQFSSDGRLILTLSEDRIAGIWNADNYSVQHTLIGHLDHVIEAEFSRDTKKVLTASLDGSAIIWDTKSGQKLKEFEHSDWIVDAHFNADGNKIVTASKDGKARIWDSNSGVKIAEIDRILLERAQFSVDGRNLITIAGGSLVSSYYSTEIWSSTTGILIKDLTGNSSEIIHASFSQDGKNFFTASKKGGAVVWDASTGLIASVLTGDDNPIRLVDFSIDGNRIAIVTENNLIRVRDKHTGSVTVKKKERFSTDTERLVVNSIRLSPDGKKLLIIYHTLNHAEVLNLETDKYFGFRKAGQSSPRLRSAEFSHDSKKIVANLEDETVNILDAQTGSLLKSLGKQRNLVSVQFSHDDDKILTLGDGIVQVWDVNSGIVLFKLNGESGEINYACFSQDGMKIITTERTGESEKKNIVKTWDSEKGNQLTRFQMTGQWTLEQQNPNDEIIIARSDDRKIHLWEQSTGRLLANLQVHSSEINSSRFSPGGRKIITGSQDNTVNLWESRSGKHIATILSIDSSEYFVQINSGYYQCSPAVSKLLHYVTKDLKVITFEQLDVKYNRPDKVLEAFGNSDTALIKSYRKAWEKRIKKLGVDTTAFKAGYSVPEADFTNREAIEYEQKNETLTLHIKGSDSTYKLDRFNVWVNETPLYGQRGISVRKRNANSIDTTIIIRLSQGENRIETSITNINGTESYRMPLLVNYTPEKPEKEVAYFIGIGIDKFSDNKFNLQYSSKDIRDLSIKLKEKYGSDIVFDTLFNENVTVSNVKALKQRLQQTTVNDKVIVSYSGHGLLSRDFDYYLSTYSINFDKPEENGLPYDELESLLDSIPARKKLMLIDACHSGEVDKEDLITLNATADSLIKGIKPVAYKKEGQLGLKNSFELMQSLFVNVGKSTGATIISAAAGTQFALERSDLKNGVFTYSILEAMKNHPQMKISELKTIVGKRVEELTRGLQKPTSRNETIAVDWSIW